MNENNKIWEELLSSLSYECYELVDDMPYGIYRLSVVNDRDEICISVVGENMTAVGKISKSELIDLKMEEFFNLVNYIIYYNAIEESERN